MAQQLFLSLGVGIAALVLHVSLRMRGAAALSALDFVPAFLITAVLSMLSSACFAPLARNAGAEVSGRRATGELAPALHQAADAD
jgi:hypothetical protein